VKALPAIEGHVTYEEWEAQIPVELRQDTLWRVSAYRKALFISDLAWHDSVKIAKARRLLATADQLYRAASNISSNISEGYSRGTGKDRARLYEYALGSARETRDWYYKSRHALDEAVVAHRIGLGSELIRLILKMVVQERSTNRRVKA
jgi:four helix bundle protein